MTNATQKATSHWATVTNTTPLKIKPRGSSQSAPALALPGYTPALNDEVAYVVLEGKTLLVLGKPS